MSLKDFTPAQAERWIKQEFDKSISDPKKRADSERAQQKMFDAHPDLAAKYPNSTKARQELVRRLDAAAAKVTA